ncbi:MAG TPA: hypothetical protein ENL21_03855 [Caldithrix abyssi]|uniref:Uncharacterized protein n=1 Tax=Caldithrix abyssi TaxID=187145 RepID=A0A7V5H2Z9_CALAY|nr:hypothetical protein [Caldisericaceae bacterium]HHE54891.1 hypothetical protein [Caldithrix abyssi]
MDSNRDQYDQLDLYCRKLGHHVKFEYCRYENFGKFCSKVRDCWFETIPIDEYLKANYSEEEIVHLFHPPKSKIVSIFELIQRAQQQK